MKVVAPRLRPTTVVLGFGVNVLNALSGEAATYGVYRRSRVVRQAEGEGSLLDLADVWLRGHVALYRDRVVLRNPFSEPKVGGAFVYDPPLSPDGWNEGFQGLRLGTTAAALSTAAAEVRLNLLQGFAVSEAKIVELGDLIDSLHRNGVDVILVTLPASSALIAAVGGAPQYQTAVGTLLAIGRSHGARTASAGVWPTTDFADAAHLNLAGTAQFSSWLGRVLRPEPAGK